MNVATKSLANLTAIDLMSHEFTAIPRHVTLRSAAHRLSQAGISGAPVVDACGACIGVISSTDFVHWAEGSRPVRHDHAHSECVCSDWQVCEAESLPTEEVGNYMTVDPVTAQPTTRIAELARMMLDAHIHRIIIVNQDNHPIGIVSATDILAALASTAAGS